MNAIKRSQHLHFLGNWEEKIFAEDKIENACLHSENRRAIKEYCVNPRGQLLHLAQKKRDMIKPQAFVYDAFDYIETIHSVGGHNVYKNTFQRVQKEVFGISRAKVQ